MHILYYLTILLYHIISVRTVEVYVKNSLYDSMQGYVPITEAYRHITLGIPSYLLLKGNIPLLEPSVSGHCIQRRQPCSGLVQ